MHENEDAQNDWYDNRLIVKNPDVSRETSVRHFALSCLELLSTFAVRHDPAVRCRPSVGRYRIALPPPSDWLRSSLSGSSLSKGSLCENCDLGFPADPANQQLKKYTFEAISSDPASEKQYCPTYLARLGLYNE